jgi:predicted O-methyltransferase YrrM
MNSSDEVRKLVDDLSTSVWAFSTLSAAAEAGLLEPLAEPCTPTYLSEHSGVPVALVERILDVLVALGLARREGDRFAGEGGLVPLLDPVAGADLLADLRSTYLQSRDLVDRAKQRILAPGWRHSDPELLQAQGASGRALTQMLAEQVFPMLEGLSGRLRAPSAAFLDAGTGVGTIAIELCRLFPELRAVGLEPQEAPLAEARRNVAVAGLGARIELRQQRVEDLTDRETFDLAYLPQVFMPADVVRRGLRAVWSALRPGGWISLPAISAPGGELGPALSRLRNVLWGGDALDAEEVAAIVREAGFESVFVGGAPGSGVKGIVGRRPE